MKLEEVQLRGEERGIYGLRKLSSNLTLGLMIGLLILGLCLGLSLVQGAKEIPLATAWQAFTDFKGSTEQTIVLSVRLPRSLVAILVGAALAVAGALMQGLTSNPLADPGILGLESGAALAVVMAVFYGDAPSLTAYAGFAFLGAGLTAIAVYGLSSLGRGGVTPFNLTIVGAACSAFLSSMTTGILILSRSTLEEIRFWLAGSLAGRDFSLLVQVLPYMFAGLAIAFILGKQVTTLNLGEDVAKGLGQKTWWVKIATAFSIVLLAGSAVAIAGPIGFIGLVVPHIVRFWVGVDYSSILPYAAITGAILLLLADVVSRCLIAPQELPVGVMSAIVGAPFFMYLTRVKVKK
jgi:iron complex transport system permease protein